MHRNVVETCLKLLWRQEVNSFNVNFHPSIPYNSLGLTVEPLRLSSAVTMQMSFSI